MRRPNTGAVLEHTKDDMTSVRKEGGSERSCFVIVVHHHSVMHGYL